MESTSDACLACIDAVVRRAPCTDQNNAKPNPLTISPNPTTTISISRDGQTAIKVQPPPHTNMAAHLLNRLLRPSLLPPSITRLSATVATRTSPSTALTLFRFPQPTPIPSTRAHKCTLIQVLRNGRTAQSARKLRSPALVNRPEMKGVCLKVGTTKPKKPNSGERKIARVRLSTGKVVTAYIPGEGSSMCRFFQSGGKRELKE